jgi:hypothetical protein
MKQLISMTVALVAAYSAAVQAATVNVGAVANSTATGQFLTVLPGGGTSITTTGQIKVGFFDITTTDLQTLVNSWSPTSSYNAYSLLNSHFTQIGTVINPSSSGGTLGGTLAGLYTTAGSGWNFSSSGNVSGTANYVDLALAPQNTQMYIWAFNGSDFTSGGFNSTQWALVTHYATGQWKLPGSGALSMVLNTVGASGSSASADVVLGVDNGNNVNMVDLVPEPSTGALMMVGAFGLLAMRRLRKV